jgi:hypothetical protein
MLVRWLQGKGAVHGAELTLTRPPHHPEKAAPDMHVWIIAAPGIGQSTPSLR